MSNLRILPLGGGLDPQDVYTKEEVNALIADFITNTVDDLTNYYLKSETYTQTEVNNLVGQITAFEVVAALPQSDIKTNVIYLLGPTGSGADKYDEYIYSNNQWVKIGETSVDLSNYVTTTALNTALEAYTPTANLATVATSGSYSDLSGTPTDLSDFNNDEGFITQNDVLAYKAFPSGWPTTGTMAQLIAAINADADALEGMSYMATVSYSDLPASLLQGEIKVDIMSVDETLGKNIDFTLTSSNQSPYHWEYTSAYGAAGTWRSWLPSGTAIPDELNDLNDVNITTPTNGQVLKYNSTSQKWENGTGGGGGNTVELTQTQYDALQTKDPDTTYIITDADAIDMDDYALASTVTTGLAAKADKQTVTANTNAKKFPHWNEQGVITGEDTDAAYSHSVWLNGTVRTYYSPVSGYVNDNVYAPTSAGTSGQIPISAGSGAPSWGDLSSLTGGLKFWLGTQAQYNALSPNYDSNTLYVISD